MSIYSNKVGLRNVGSYMVSGTPWVTGSTSFTAEKTIQHSFPNVTKSFTVINKGTVDIIIHFHEGQSQNPHSLSANGVDGVGGAKVFTNTDNYYANKNYITVPANDGAVTLDVKIKVLYLSTPTATTAGAYELYAELTEIPADSMYALSGSGITGT
tara:strand:+ start:6219 stop:6686 length:468 start_codon:yes stop_codon:yes gene_type:complete